MHKRLAKLFKLPNNLPHHQMGSLASQSTTPYSHLRKTSAAWKDPQKWIRQNECAYLKEHHVLSQSNPSKIIIKSLPKRLLASDVLAWLRRAVFSEPPKFLNSSAEWRFIKWPVWMYISLVPSGGPVLNSIIKTYYWAIKTRCNSI